MTHSRSPDDGVQSISVTQFQTSNCAIETIGSLADMIRRRSQSWRILRRFDGFGKTSVASCLLCCLRAHKIPLATVSFATRCHWGETLEMWRRDRTAPRPFYREMRISGIFGFWREMKRRGGEELNCTEIFSLQGGGNGNAKSDAAPAAIGNTF